MDGSMAPAPAEGSEPTDKAKADDARPVVDVADKGDIILDVTFETSHETLKKTRKAALAASRKSPLQTASPTLLKPRVRVAYRVNLEVMKTSSKYFGNLLSNPQFSEAKTISEKHANLNARSIRPGDADAGELPHILITDDDEATQTAGREEAFEDMLRLMHKKAPKTTKVVMSFIATMAVIADRFDCIAAVSRPINIDLKFKWPLTNNRPLVDENGRATEVEKILRQKIFVSWLLTQPLRLNQASRELIMRGSRLWSTLHDPQTEDLAPAWWDLPDGLEEELHYRRECILNTIASVQKHFLDLYTSKERQCKLGYDSSAACDSFQLGQMTKFLVSKDLLFLVDFSPASIQAVPDTAMLDITELVSTLKQCPNYQLDKHHVNCGLRIRIEPILDYINAMLSANAVAVSHADWKQRRTETTWATKKDSSQDNEKISLFSFTRALANDQRLRYEGALHSDRMAKKLFTAEMWDWTPESRQEMGSDVLSAKFGSNHRWLRG